jgi:urease accessory protein
MHSQVLIIASAGRLPRTEYRGALAVRHTLPDTVHLVSAAPGAVLHLRSTAAAMVLPGVTSHESHAQLTLEVGGVLDVDLEPTIIAAHAVHTSHINAAIDAAGELRLRERVQIGRTGEQQGFWTGSLHADVKGQPLLRHRIELGAGAPGDDVIAAPRACISELCYPTEQPTPTQIPMTVLGLAGGGVLSTWQGLRLPAS